jgi:hypothetical protein
MEKKKYGKYISKEIIEQSKYSRITAPIVNYRGDRGGKDMTFEWSCITNPLVMDAEPEVNDFDQFLLFVGSDINNLGDFQAEIELPMGKEKTKQIINEPKLVYIPQGLIHGPVNFKSIKKPIAFLSINFSPKYSTKWVAPDYSKYMIKPNIGDVLTRVEAVGPDGACFRYQETTSHGMALFCKSAGLGGNMCTTYSVNKQPHIGFEPRHYHRNLDEWIIFIGSDPLNVEDFDGEIELWFGEEHERELIDSTAVAHLPPGLIHYSTDVRVVKKPFIEMVMVSTGDYFGGRPKVIVSKREEGDIMLSKTREWENDPSHPSDCTCKDCVFARTQGTMGAM